MVAITNNGFGRFPTSNSTHSDIISPRLSGPLTPTSSDCLSISSDSDALDSSVLSEHLAPVRRDPALLIERLENSIGRRRMGKRKMRRAMNDAALAALVEGHEEAPSLVMRPYHSAFQQLLESPTNMMVWYHFTNLSEEDQRMFLAGPQQRAHVTERPLNASPRHVVAAPRPSSGAVTVVDSRSLHPAALPHSPSRAAHGLTREAPVPMLAEPLLGVGGPQHPFGPPVLHASVPSEQVAPPPAACGTGSAAANSTAATTAASAAPPLAASEPLGDYRPSTDREYCRTSSPARATAAAPQLDVDPLCAASDVSLLDESQSSTSSFEVLDEADTDHETEDFLLLGQ